MIDDYRQGLDSLWEEKIFHEKTIYEVVEAGGRFMIKAESQSAASALYRQVDLDLTDYPILSWSWKIDRVLNKGDARRKAGDDFAARIYVVFPSWLFWRTRTISYIWANKLPVGETIESPYTSNAIMIAVQSGNEKAGKWVVEKRNVLEDYRQCFKGDPPKGEAIAIMTDTDDTGESTTAWYGPIWVKSQ